MKTKNNRIPQRYAKAFFDLAEETGHLKEAHKDLSAVAAVIRESSELQAFIATTSIPVFVQKNVVQDLFEKRVSALTFKFLSFLAHQDRLNYLLEVCQSFDSLFLNASNILKVDIVSAVHLTENQIAAITERFKKTYNKTIHPTQKVDSNLLGGFKVKIKDLIFDLSLQSQLANFKRIVLNT